MNHTSSGQYKYDAFISYSHLDKKAAVALQQRLERYRIPKEIRVKRGSPSSGLKIFRDETDLPAGSLTAAVCEALDASRKLIVVCSAETKGEDKYKWVSQEVQHFTSTGRSDDILPLLLDGSWEEMPETLKPLQDSQFITDVTKLKKRTAFLKILSGVLGTDFDALVKRDKVRRRIGYGILTAACLLLAAAGYYYFCPHTTYYADYVVRYGKPEGIEPLTAAQRAVRSESYAITITRSKHEICLEHINSAGLVSTDTSENHLEPLAAAVYSCLNDWQINTVSYLDEDGKQLYTYSYAPDLSYLDIINSKDDAQWRAVQIDNESGSIPVYSNISRYQLRFDDDGFLRRRMYAVDRLASINEDGIGGELCRYDQQGRLEEITYLNTVGTPDVNKDGIAGKRVLYNDAQRISGIEYYGTDGCPINTDERYAAIRYDYNADGNISEIRYYDSDNAPVITTNGYAVEILGYSNQGFITFCAYLGINDEPVRCQYRFHEVQLDRDDMGRDICTTYLDIDGGLILTTWLYAKRVTQYNDQGLVEDQFYYGTDGSPNLGSTGSHHVHSGYDDQGNLSELAHYGTDGDLTFSSLGYAVMRLTYNEMGMQRTSKYFGVHDEPISGKDGYHQQELIYDDRYNIHEIRLTGTSGQPVLCTDGYALRIMEYDNSGNILSDAYFDDYDQPVLRTGSYSKAAMQYDERGRRTQTDLFDPDGTPASNAAYSTEKVKYDDTGRAEKVWYYRLDELTSMREYTYDGTALTEQTDFLSGSEDGPRRVHRYDTRGNEVETTLFSPKGLSSRTVSEYDAYGSSYKKSFYNAQNELSSYYITDFNRSGQPIRTAYYNAAGQLSREANSTEHVAIVESDYAEGMNLKIERRCYDENGQPLRITSGEKEAYARLTMEYDKSGNCIRLDYYDEAGNIYQSIIQEYDEYNRECNRIYQDGEGKQLVRKEVHYNSLGKATFTALYNRQDELQADPSTGVAKILYTIDSYNYVVSEEFYGANDQPVAPYGTYHKYTLTRENGRTTEIRYYGTDGQPALNQDGYAMERFTYDERGNEIGRAFFGVNDEPILLKWRFSRYEVQYDEVGELKEVRYFDTADREVQQVGGHLQKKYSYINNIPRKLLYFSGDDGTSLMGDIEMKLYIPLQVFVEPLGEDEVADAPEGSSADEEMPSEEEMSAEPEPEETEEPGPEETDGEPASDARTDPTEKEQSPFSDREYIGVINDYVRAVERFEGTGVMDVMSQSLFKVAETIAANQLSIEISQNKIYHFYAAFYEEELAALQASLLEKYGDSLYITYEITSEEYTSAEDLAAMNQTYEDLGVDGLVIQQMVALGITYTVSGSDAQGIEDTGFLSQPLVLLQIDGRWTLGTGEQFPKPPQDRLIKLYTEA